MRNLYFESDDEDLDLTMIPPIEDLDDTCSPVPQCHLFPASIGDPDYLYSYDRGCELDDYLMSPSSCSDNEPQSRRHSVRFETKMGSVFGDYLMSPSSCSDDAPQVLHNPVRFKTKMGSVFGDYLMSPSSCSDDEPQVCHESIRIEPNPGFMLDERLRKTSVEPRRKVTATRTWPPGTGPDMLARVKQLIAEKKRIEETMAWRKDEATWLLGSAAEPEWACESKHLRAETLSDAYDIYQKYGIVVLLGQFSAAECKEFVTSSATMLTDMSLATAIETHDGSPRKIWRPSAVYDNTLAPPMSQFGHFDTVANGAHQWQTRASEPVFHAFKYFYNRLVGQDVGEFFTSIDGLIFHPDTYASALHEKTTYSIHRTKDTSMNKTFFGDNDFIFGQCVFSNSQNVMTCCPESHLYYENISKQYVFNRDQTKLTRQYLSYIIKELDPTGANWGTRIWAPAGSIILWDSRLVVSSQLSRNVNEKLVRDLISGSETICSRLPSLEPPSRVYSVDEARRLLDFNYGPAYDAGYFEGWRCAFNVTLSPKQLHRPNAREYSNALIRAWHENKAVSRVTLSHKTKLNSRPSHKLPSPSVMYKYTRDRPDHWIVKHLIDYNGPDDKIAERFKKMNTRRSQKK